MRQTEQTQLRADFSRREVVRPPDEPWVDSPIAGVERRRLDRIGDEVARATSLVRYAPNSRFPEHAHGRGEEFLVVEGVFKDEHGQYPVGTYVRNPPGSKHAPFVDEGCTIFVKLRQFDDQDTTRVVVDTTTAAFSPGVSPGLSVLPLHEFGTVHTALVRWQPGTEFHEHRHLGGEEIYVIEGTFSDEFGDYPRGSWLRNPSGSTHRPFSKEGCLILVKVGHLPG